MVNMLLFLHSTWKILKGKLIIFEAVPSYTILGAYIEWLKGFTNLAVVRN
jgi:hypothetical protein